MSLNPVARSWLLRLYPYAWRARYGDEFDALLEDCPLTPFALFDVLLGALDAHIAPLDADGRILRMLNRPRRSAITVFCAYIAFVLAGLSFNQMIEDDLNTLNSPHPDLAAAYYIVAGGAAVALLAVLIGGLPIAFSAIRGALQARRGDILLLFAVPPVALAIWLAWTWILLNVIWTPQSSITIHQTSGAVLFLSWAGLFGLAALASTASVSIAVSRSELAPRQYRIALAPAVVAALAMVVVLGGLVAWGVLIRSDVPAYLNSATTPFRITVSTMWIGQIVVMAIAVLIAATALVRGLRVRGDDLPASLGAMSAR